MSFSTMSLIPANSIEVDTTVSPPPMVLILGETGAGKSNFINKLSPGSAQVGHKLESCTTKPMLIPAVISQKPVLLVDTPGFNDTYRSDVEILREIAGVLTLQFGCGVKLCGVLYLHDILSPRITGSSARQLAILQRIVGEENFRNVVLVTTKWPSRCSEPDIGAPVREGDLRQRFWEPMLRGRAGMCRFDGTPENAACIVRGLLGRAGDEGVVLRLQRELMQDRMILHKTAAGQMVVGFRESEQQMLHNMNQWGGNVGGELKEEVERLTMSIKRRTEEEERLKEDILEKVRAEVEEVVKKQFEVQGKKSTVVNVIGWLIGICSLGIGITMQAAM
ncbi:P-loop containing nucleoside triphosphate hydrolase protein [Geopyxis carbonaria]|nr:P-loop containing nucleoside triphosphate hydrolase protein [Geopyxis carbonaria]